MIPADVSHVTTDSPEATEAAGRDLAGSLAPGDLVVLEADLAAGKTTFVRGLLDGLGGDPAQVTSPTFVLVQPYPASRTGISVLYHVDLYRVADDPAALREIGLEEMLSETAAVVAVEWPKKALADWLPLDARVWRVEIVVEEGRRRRITVGEARVERQG